MRFLADECCDLGLVQALRADEHDVVFAAETMRGAVDQEVLLKAFEEDRILLTECETIASSRRTSPRPSSTGRGSGSIELRIGHPADIVTSRSQGSA